MDVIFFIGLGLLLPLVHLPLRLKWALWIFIGLYPLYLVHKSMFVLVNLAGKSIQIPTLTKDLVCLVLLVCLFILLCVREGKLSRLPHAKLLFLFVALTAYMFVVGMVQGNGLMKTLMGTRPYTFFPLAGVLIGGFLLNSRADLERLANVLLGGVLFLAITGLVHAYLDQNFLILDCFNQLWNGKLTHWYTYLDRLKSFFTSANVLGLIMAFGIAISFWKLMARPAGGGGGLQAVAMILLMGIFSWVMVLTLSRSAILAAGMSCFLISLIVTGRLPKLIIMTLSLAALALIYLTPFAQRFENLADNPRLIIWAVFLKASVSSWRYFLLGHGAGSVGRFGADVSVASDLKDPGLGAISGIGQGDETFVVDNFYIRSLYENGIIGITIMLLLVGYLLWITYKVLKSSNRQFRYHLALPLTICFFILMVSLLGDLFGTYPWNLFFWMNFSFILHTFYKVAEEDKLNENCLVHG